MMRNKLFTTINVLGLSVSMACCLLLFLYVTDQLNYDKHHGGDIYRLTSFITQNGTDEVINASSCSVPFAPALEEQLPEVEVAARVISSGIFGKDIIYVGDQSFYVPEGAVADTTIFKTLHFDIVSGDQSNPLPDGKSVVLEQEWAYKLFGQADPIGEVVKITTGMGSDDFIVSAVYNKKTFASHLQPSFFISTTSTGWNEFVQSLSDQWVTNNLTFTYLKLSSTVNIPSVLSKIDKIFQKNGAEDMEGYGMGKTLDLQAIADIHTSDVYDVEAKDTVNPVFINVLVGIGILIMVLACVNYINLSTAQASNRAMEVGVRKVMGISSRGLIAQFLGESFIVVLVSLVLSVLIAELTLPVFNQLVNDPVSLNMDNITLVAIYLGSFLFVTAFVAGIYPAIYLASFKATSVLKGKNKDNPGATLLRQVLVTVQFVISIVLISAILVISDQVEFIKNKDLGFQSSSRIVLPLPNEVQGQFNQLKENLKGLTQVRNVAAGNYIPGQTIYSDLFVYREDQTIDDAIQIYQNGVDADYLNTLKINLLAGTQFDPGSLNDTTSQKVIINREASKQLGYEVEEAVGEILNFVWGGQIYDFKVVGVMQDVNQASLHENISPVMLVLHSRGFSNLIIAADIVDYKHTISNIESIWKELVPETPFESFTLDDHMIKQYESDFKTFNLIKYFAIISIFISSMGLYALSMYVAERRFKEIGVRKALGAEIKDILLLVSKDLSLLVIIAFVLSIPISIYAMNLWLDGFAYKITQSVWTYVIAGAISVSIAWLTIGYQSLRAANTNPVDVLKDE